MYRLILIIAAALPLALTTGCSKEESPKQPVAKEQQATQQPAETAKEAPMVTTEHAKEAAHRGIDVTHEAMKQAHDEMKEAHQATTETLATGQATAETLAMGLEVYVKNCAACHSTGVAGAPKLGDKTAWSVHLPEGIDHLMYVALNGEGAMPARGGNPSLTDEEVKAAVSYMLEQSR